MGKWLGILMVVVCVAAVVFGVYRKLSSKPVTIKQDFYLVVDVAASPQWKASHTVTCTINGQPVSLPLVLHSPVGIGFGQNGDRPGVEELFTGDRANRYEIALQATPAVPLREVRVGGGGIKNTFGPGVLEISYTSRVIWSPEGEAAPVPDAVTVVEEARKSGTIVPLDSIRADDGQL